MNKPNPQRIYDFLVKYKFELAFLALLLGAIAFRFYKIDSRIMLPGDPGRDLLTVLNWQQHGTIPWRGPVASVGSFHTGPLYFYLIGIAFLFPRPEIGSIVMCSMLGLAGICLVWMFLRNNTNSRLALVFGLLALTSPRLNGAMARSIWNPNLLPVFVAALLVIVYKLINGAKHQQWLYFAAGLVISIGAQFHYTFLINILFFVAAIAIFARAHIRWSNIWPLLIGLAVPWLPFLYGQIRHHNYSDFAGIVQYFRQPRADAVSLLVSVKNFLHSVRYALFAPFTTYFDLDFVRPTGAGLVLFVFWPVCLIYVTVRTLTRKLKYYKLSLILLVWFAIAAASLVLSGMSAQFQYTYFFDLIVLLIIALAVNDLMSYGRTKVLAGALVGVLVCLSVQGSLSMYSSLSDRAQTLSLITDRIKQDNPTSPVKFLVLSFYTLKPGYEYRYFFQKSGLSVNPAMFEDINAVDYVIVDNGLGSRPIETYIDPQWFDAGHRAEQIYQIDEGAAKMMTSSGNVGLYKVVSSESPPTN